MISPIASRLCARSPGITYMLCIYKWHSIPWFQPPLQKKTLPSCGVYMNIHIYNSIYKLVSLFPKIVDLVKTYHFNGFFACILRVFLVNLFFLPQIQVATKASSKPRVGDSVSALEMLSLEVGEKSKERRLTPWVPGIVWCWWVGPGSYAPGCCLVGPLKSP